MTSVNDGVVDGQTDGWTDGHTDGPDGSDGRTDGSDGRTGRTDRTDRMGKEMTTFSMSVTRQALEQISVKPFLYDHL